MPCHARHICMGYDGAFAVNIMIVMARSMCPISLSNPHSGCSAEILLPSLLIIASSHVCIISIRVISAVRSSSACRAEDLEKGISWVSARTAQCPKASALDDGNHLRGPQKRLAHPGVHGT